MNINLTEDEVDIIIHCVYQTLNESLGPSTLEEVDGWRRLVLKFPVDEIVKWILEDLTNLENEFTI